MKLLGYEFAGHFQTSFGLALAQLIVYYIGQ